MLPEGQLCRRHDNLVPPPQSSARKEPTSQRGVRRPPLCGTCNSPRPLVPTRLVLRSHCALNVHSCLVLPLGVHLCRHSLSLPRRYPPQTADLFRKQPAATHQRDRHHKCPVHILVRSNVTHWRPCAVVNRIFQTMASHASSRSIPVSGAQPRSAAIPTVSIQTASGIPAPQPLRVSTGHIAVVARYAS